MTTDTLKKAVAKSQETGYLFIATADRGGLPHIAAGGPLTLLPDKKQVAFETWFCPRTVANVSINRWMSLAIWNPSQDDGYQLLGWVEEVQDILLLDGFSPEMEKKGPVPPAKKRLTLRVDKVIGFHRSAHTDEPL